MDIIFMGTPDFAIGTLDAIEKAGHNIVMVVTQPDKPKGRGRKMVMSPVKEWAVERNIPVFQPKRIRDPESIAEFRHTKADIAVVAAFGQILPEKILEAPKYGCINVHASLLPKYRGAAPIQWSILNGDEVTGVTIMQMGPGLDDGDILLQEEVPIAENETGGSLFEKLSQVGGDLSVKALEGIENHTIIPVPQDPSKATHVGMIRKDLGKIDFSQDAAVIERYVRGLNPWPGTYTYFHNKMLKVWKASVIPEDSIPKRDEVPVTVGTIETLTTEGSGAIIVRCGKGFLALEEVQLEGKKRMSAADFMRGHELTPGDVFGL